MDKQEQDKNSKAKGESTASEKLNIFQKLKVRSAERDEQIENIMQATGWDKSKTKAELRKALTKGIKAHQYLNRHWYDLNDSELTEAGRYIRMLADQEKEEEQFYIDQAVRKSGWTRAEVIADMDRLQPFGIGRQKYVQRGCWMMDEDTIHEFANSSLKRVNNRVKRNRKNYISKVSKITGWSYGKTDLEILKAKVNCGASYEDYYVFKFYEMTPEEQKEYVTLNDFVRMRLTYNDCFMAAKPFNEKDQFNEIFSDLIQRKWFVNRDITFEEFLQKIDGLDALLVKHIAATQGIGISKYELGPDVDKRELYDKLMNDKRCIVEQYIVQHEEVAKFCPTSVNTVRVTTLNYKGECKFLYSVFRMGRGAVVDNFHAGGIAASVDVETGTVITDAADLEGNTFALHPYSNEMIKGFQIPHWDIVKEICEKATGRLENFNLIGWDFAITPDGVELIEGNPGASYVVAQIPNIADRIGLKKVMIEPYL